jgi:hypothetical protein
MPLLNLGIQVSSKKASSSLRERVFTLQDDVVVPEQLKLSFEEMPEEILENLSPKTAQEEHPPQIMTSQTS